MNTSEFVYQAVMEKMQTNKLNDSQSQFVNLFDVAFKKSFEPYFKQIMLVQNKIEFNVDGFPDEENMWMKIKTKL